MGKKVAIMQPYFFPYMGYFSLIKHTDEFILFDPVQFIRHGWIERNRILKQGGGWIYIKVPLNKFSRDTIIKDVGINNDTLWQDKILAQLNTYKKKAPFYYKVKKLLDQLFSEKFTSITKLNEKSIELVCDYLNIELKMRVFSEMDLSIQEPNEPDEWALNICKAMGGVKEYWNAKGGEEFFSRKKYEANGISIHFLNLKSIEYQQIENTFEPGLSILDTLMFNSPKEINSLLDQYDLK